MSFLLFLFFLLGTFIGSFLNVLILRQGSGVSILGRSFCFSCGRKISWYDLLPVFSFLLLSGKCRSCRSKISWQYPMVEIFSGLLFAGAFWKLFSGDISSSFLISLTLHFLAFSSLLALSVYDFYHKIIPDAFVWPFIFFSFLIGASSVGTPPYSFLEIANLLSGPFLFSLFWALWHFSAGRWMGFGDAKLVLGIGFFLGMSKGLSAVTLGFWSGALFSLLFLFLSKTERFSSLRRGGRSLTMKSEVPFAPFLVLGFFLAFFLNIDLFSLNVFFTL